MQKFTRDMFDVKIKEKGSVDKSNISNLVKSSDLDIKFAMRATEADLKSEQDEITKWQTFVSSYFFGKIFFEDDGTHNYLVF